MIPANRSRREALAIGGAALTMPLIPATAAGQDAVGSMMVERAQTALSQIDEGQLASAQVEFDNRLRQGWNFMHGSRRAPGLPMEDMTAEQKDAALDLLATALSPEGLQTAMHIMLQQDIMRDEWGKGSPDRNRDRFSLIVFGNPSMTESWGWRWEGHHLSLNFTLIGSEIVSVTPSSFSSEPNTVPSGPHEGLVVLAEEEPLGRLIYTELSESQCKQALLQDGSYGNILTTAGREDRVTDYEGIAIGDLSQIQIDRALRLLEVFTSERLERSLSSWQFDRAREGDLMETHFAWTGADLDGSIYFRLHGPTFLVEYATLRNQPQHHHAVRHDFAHNFGRHRVS